GAELGILFRSSEALERLHAAGVVVLDKTGTVTRGQPALVQVVARALAPAAAPGAGAAGGQADADTLLRLAAAAERGSEHPVGRAVTAAAEARGWALPEPEGFEAVPGAGIRARVEGLDVRVGTRRFL